MPTTLVLGYDGSDDGKRALAHTVDLAGHLDDGEVFVVSAYEFSIGYVPMGMTDSPLMITAEYDQHIDLVRAACEAQVADAVGQLTAAGVPAAERPARGRPWTCSSRPRGRRTRPRSWSAATDRAWSRPPSSDRPRSSCCTTARSPSSWCRAGARDARRRRRRPGHARTAAVA